MQSNNNNNNTIIIQYGFSNIYEHQTRKKPHPKSNSAPTGDRTIPHRGNYKQLTIPPKLSRFSLHHVINKNVFTIQSLGSSRDKGVETRHFHHSMPFLLFFFYFFISPRCNISDFDDVAQQKNKYFAPIKAPHLSPPFPYHTLSRCWLNGKLRWSRVVRSLLFRTVFCTAIPLLSSFFFFFAKKKRRNKRKRKEKVVSPGCDSWKERRPNRVFGAFVLIPKFGTLNRGAVLKVLAAGNGGRRIIPAMFHAMRLTACARWHSLSER